MIQEEAKKVEAEAKTSVQKFKSNRRPPRILTDYLPVGIELKFKDGDQVCKIFDQRHVEFKGVVKSLTRLTVNILD